MSTEACTLPTADRPMRLDEFDSLFADAVRHVSRDGDVVRLHLTGPAGLRDRVRDLTERETACCSFFTFVIDGGADDLVLEVSVPPRAPRHPPRRGAAGDRDVRMSLRAGEVAQAAGINRETLRYYERRGLLGTPDRSPGGHRLYDDRAVATLRVIKAAQRLGFTLHEVADLIAAGRGRGRDSGLQRSAREQAGRGRGADRRPRADPRQPARRHRRRL